MDRVVALALSPRRWNLFIALVVLLAILWTWRSAVPATATTAGLVPAPREGFPLEAFRGDSVIVAGTLREAQLAALLVTVAALWLMGQWARLNPSGSHAPQ